MASEKIFENKIKKYLKDETCYTVKYHGDRFSQVGVPDLLVCCEGKFLGLEIKAINGKPSELQLVNLDDINKSGGFGAIVVPTEGVKKIKRYILDNFNTQYDVYVIDFDTLKKVIENNKNVVDNNI